MSDVNLLFESLALPLWTRNSWLASLSAPEAALLAPSLRDVYLTRDSVLYEAGDPIDYVYFPHSAVIAGLATFEDGQAVVTEVVGREAACGIGVALDLPRALNCSVVLMRGTAARITAAEFRAVSLKSNVLREASTRCIALLLCQLHQSTACNASHSLEERLSRWLLECSDRVGSDMQLTQCVLARMLGVRRTSVSLVASSLQSSGAIEYRRGVIRILDRPALEASACECYRTVRQRADVLASNCINASYELVGMSAASQHAGRHARTL